MGGPGLSQHFPSSPGAGGGTLRVPAVVSPYRRGPDSDVTDHHQRAFPGTPRGGPAETRASGESREWGRGGGRASSGGLTWTAAPDRRPEAGGPGVSATTLHPLPSGKPAHHRQGPALPGNFCLHLPQCSLAAGHRGTVHEASASRRQPAGGVALRSDTPTSQAAHHCLSDTF